MEKESVQEEIAEEHAQTKELGSEQVTLQGAGKKKVVILGAGLAGLFIAQKINKRKDCEVTLVSPSDHFVFLMRLTELVAKSVPDEKVLLPLSKVWKGKLVKDKAAIINPEERAVVLESGNTLHYDYLVVAIGSQTNFFGTPGANHAFPFYNKDDAEKLLEHVNTMLSGDESGGNHTFAVIGGGPTGVEVANTLSAIVKKQRPKARLLLINLGPSILSMFPKIAPDVHKILENKGFEILNNTTLKNINPLSIEIQKEGQNKETIPCYTTVWAAGSKPASIQITDLELTERKEIPIEKTLQVKGHPNIFAVGDISASGAPKTAQAAFQQAQVAVDNINNLLSGKKLTEFNYSDRGVFIALDKDTCGMVYGNKISGFVARTLRDKYYSFRIMQYK